MPTPTETAIAEALAKDKAARADAARFAGAATRAPVPASATVDPSVLLAEAKRSDVARAMGESKDTAALAERAKPYESGAGGSPKGTAAAMIDAARTAGRAASDEASRLDAEAAKRPDAVPDPSVAYPPGTASPGPAKSTATSASELVAAPPSKVAQVLDKLKAEEAKGGPDFWDVIQAAAAGWGGQVPLYVQKEMAKKAQEAETAQTETILQREAEIRAGESAKEQEFQRQMAREELANRLKLAGIATGGGAGKLSLDEFMGGK